MQMIGTPVPLCRLYVYEVGGRRLGERPSEDGGEAPWCCMVQGEGEEAARAPRGIDRNSGSAT